MGFLRISSHLVPLIFQASLLQLVWTQPKYLDNPTVRWMRISLLPISLGLLFFNHSMLRDDTEIIRPLKVNLGCMFAGQFFKSILFAFNRPSSARVSKSRESTVPHGRSILENLFAVLLLLVNGSSNPSKPLKLVTGGSQHTIRSDVVFLLYTIRRMMVLNIFGVLGLYCWKALNDEALIGSYPILKRYAPQITAVIWGVFVWTSIDLGGCMNRISAFGFKSFHRLLSRWIPRYQTILSIDFTILDLEQTCPFYFKKSPLEASSITDFWSRHWHLMLKDLFVEAGSKPFTSFVIWTFGTRKAHPKLLRLAGTIGAFTISAIIHEVGVYSAGPFDRKLRTSIFFISQGLAACLENLFKSLSGRRVCGPLGMIWTSAWLVFFGTPMIEVWTKSIAFDEQKMFDRADQMGFWRMIFTPFCIIKLIFSVD
ncbi:hypothetical protein PGT21_018767 [Puccinia graminis f. sp. tritici]|uniref:Wax synthase domain-containing protein n=1 Tax=Puccinia graminis f. sp. tritici TaxID=56615 RepID=A0A5B0QNI6_PUCGR|nr:hypothetical protein PGT21_018767 [Puccinia graminis f. sp. tritici]